MTPPHVKPAAFGSDAEIQRLAEGMMACSLPKAYWTHAAHWAAALWILKKRPEIDACAQMPEFIRRYNESVGGKNTDTEGYHETITQASLQAAAQFLSAAPSREPLFETCNRLLASPLGRPDWVLRHWSKDVLFSPAARRAWVAPDVEPLAF